MAKSKVKTKGRSGKKKGGGGANHRREIAVIFCFLFGALSAASVFCGRDAVVLKQLRSAYTYLFGVGAIVAPAAILAFGFFVLSLRSIIIKVLAHALLISVYVLTIYHVAVTPPKWEICISPGAFRAGGGVISGLLACGLLRALAEIGSYFLLAAVALLYIKLVFRISYVEQLNRMKPGLLKACAIAGRAVAAAHKITALLLIRFGVNRKEVIAAPSERPPEFPVDNTAFDAPPFIAEPSIFGGEIDLPLEEDFDREDDRMIVITEPEAAAGPEEIEEEIEKITVSEERKSEFSLRDWKLPEASDWLDPDDADMDMSVDDTMRKKLEATMKSFKLPATIVNVVRGASFTRFEIELEPGTRVSQLISLGNDMALSLATDSRSVRIEAPIPGKSAVGVEVPNADRSMVPISRIYNSPVMQNAKSPLAFCLGEDIGGKALAADLVKMPHMLIAGSTNSGKSVCLNGVICSILAKRYPEEVRFIMVDVKRVELTPYNGVPHLLSPVICESAEAANALRWVTGEMDRRYKIFATAGVRNIDAYNSIIETPEDKMYRIVVVIDELADLMMVASANQYVETYICRITQLARATGIHVILATQRPDTKVITGTIKNNIPSRISFAVASQIDSRTILDQKGAESLLGRGDMLFMPSDSNRLLRLQGAFVSDQEVKRLVSFWKDQGEVEYLLKFEAETDENYSGIPGGLAPVESEDEMLYRKSVEIVMTSGQVSISMLQRKLRIGYNRSARLVELMEERSVVGPYDGVKPREILLTPAMYQNGEF